MKNLWIGLNTYIGLYGVITPLHTMLLTPFEVVYRKPPPNIPTYLMGTTNIEAVDAILTNRDKILALETNLEKAQNKMKLYADKQRSELQLAVGEWVYLKLQPYR